MLDNEFKYLWAAYFADGHIINQPQDDKYSKHDPEAEYNPSSFRDILDYEKKSKLVYFTLGNFSLDLKYGSISMGEDTREFTLDQPAEELIDRKLIYYRTKRANLETGEQYIYAYNFGYEGKHPETGKIMKKVVTIR